MKKLFFLSALAGLFVLLSSNTVMAQQKLGNRTACPVYIKFEYGDPVTCAYYGTLTYTVPAYSVVTLTLPPGAEILGSGGSYAAAGCGFFTVGAPCTTVPNTDFVACGSLCGDYKVRLTSSWGLVVYH